MIHRILAGAGSVVLLLAAHRAFRLPTVSVALRRTSLAVLVLIVVQILVGAANPWTGFQQWARALHLTLATLIWAGAALIAILASLRSVDPIGNGLVRTNGNGGSYASGSLTPPAVVARDAR